MRTSLLLAAALALPFAAQAANPSLKSFSAGAVSFVNGSLVPAVYALAFLLFLVGMVRFFFLGGEEGRERGKTFMFWGIIGFVVMFSVWGIVNLLLATFNIT